MRWPPRQQNDHQTTDRRHCACPARSSRARRHSLPALPLRLKLLLGPFRPTASYSFAILQHCTPVKIFGEFFPLVLATRLIWDLYSNRTKIARSLSGRRTCAVYVSCLASVASESSCAQCLTLAVTLAGKQIE
eukprot:scaffold775_cov274-Pinguiococcus_pyrenoidosus.AAC.11